MKYFFQKERLVIIALAVASAMLGADLLKSFMLGSSDIPRLYDLLPFILTTTTFFATFFWNDLRSRPEALFEGEASAAAEREFSKSTSALMRQFESQLESRIKSENLNVQKVVEEQVRKEFGSDLIRTIDAELKKKIAAAAEADNLRQIASDAFIQMRSRTIEYAESARRQSTYFRAAALALATGGLSALGYAWWVALEQFTKNPQLVASHVEWPMIIYRHAPTYGFVILCEFLALILFRYQSKSLEYMRYFSNEATNMDARRISFVAALSTGDKAALLGLVEKLEATERNFILEKGQRTLEMANNENEDRVVDRLRRVVAASQGADEAQPATKPKRPKGLKSSD